MHQKIVVDVPEEIWDQIISLLDHDRYLEPLSLVSKTFLPITNRLKQTLKISNATAHFLPKLLQRFPNLKNISFCDFHGEIDPILRLISQTPFPLSSLDLSNHTEFPSEAIQELPTSSLRSIRSLKLSNCSAVNDCHLRVISELMINLEELDLSEPRDDYDMNDVMDISGGLGITDYGVDLIASNLSNLKKVNLSGNYFISDKSVVSLAEKCPFLEDILVKNCTFVTQNGVAFVCRNCRNLRLLGVLGMDLAVPEISEPLVLATNLSVLDFSYMTVSDGLLYAIVKASIPLKKFTLYHCKEFTFSGVLSLLRTYHSLEYLALEGAYWVTDRTIIDISKFLRKATTVKLNFCSRVTSSGLFTVLKNCSMLNSLEMEKTNLGWEEFAVNDAKNVQIRALCLGANKTLSNECLEKISFSCPNLELLDVSDCPAISRKGIGEVVRKCTSLRHLHISGSGAIKSLGIDTKLPNLEVIQASGSGLNDDGLITIARKCPGLVNLDVMGCSGVSSKGVKEIISWCQRLREINLSWCRVMGKDIVPWMVFARPSLRKIAPPIGATITEVEKSLFLQHGCLVDGP
ncbi:hypothetical protein RND81_09G130100 [Saponaria officinalis]|uniref:F-box/LRR-repeat protein 15-like leucin rich repeat domain-containing protein n=1 Tax=Saponaria officinalis TaxID=3572 RepID=A0AAW1IL65_SAPOF